MSVANAIELERVPTVTNPLLAVRKPLPFRCRYITSFPCPKQRNGRPAANKQAKQKSVREGSNHQNLQGAQPPAKRATSRKAKSLAQQRNNQHEEATVRASESDSEIQSQSLTACQDKEEAQSADVHATIALPPHFAELPEDAQELIQDIRQDIELGRRTNQRRARLLERQGPEFQNVARRLRECHEVVIIKCFDGKDPVACCDRRCGYPELCELCATPRHMNNSARRYAKKLMAIRELHPKSLFQRIALTVEADFNLLRVEERLLKAARCFKDRLKRARLGRSTSELSLLAAVALLHCKPCMDGSTRWHPHLHIVALVMQRIDLDVLSRVWSECVGAKSNVEVGGMQAARLSDNALEENVRSAIRYGSDYQQGLGSDSKVVRAFVERRLSDEGNKIRPHKRLVLWGSAATMRTEPKKTSKQPKMLAELRAKGAAVTILPAISTQTLERERERQHRSPAKAIG